MYGSRFAASPGDRYGTVQATANSQVSRLDYNLMYQECAGLALQFYSVTATRKSQYQAC